MNAPQIIVICLFVFIFTVHAMKHGQPKEGTWSIGGAIIHMAIWVPLLIWGGFFS